MERQSSRFKVQEILTVKPIPNEVILVNTSKTICIKLLLLLLLLLLLIQDFPTKILIPYNSKLFMYYTITSVISDCQTNALSKWIIFLEHL